MQIFVCTPAGKTVNIDVDANDTVKTLKTAIEAAEGTPADQQHLVFAGQLLQDDNTVADYNVEKESTLHLAVKTEGGLVICAIVAAILAGIFT